MKTKLIASLCVLLAGPLALATTNTELIQEQILGQKYCYYAHPSEGWLFFKNGQAVRHGTNLGMPGPDDYYSLEYYDALRTTGLFWLKNKKDNITFIFGFTPFDIKETGGESLSTAACEST